MVTLIAAIVVWPTPSADLINMRSYITATVFRAHFLCVILVRNDGNLAGELLIDQIISSRSSSRRSIHYYP